MMTGGTYEESNAMQKKIKDTIEKNEKKLEQMVLGAGESLFYFTEELEEEIGKMSSEEFEWMHSKLRKLMREEFKG